jgi:hypothetical protein
MVPRIRRVTSESSTMRIRKADDISAPVDEPDAAWESGASLWDSSPKRMAPYADRHNHREHLVFHCKLWLSASKDPRNNAEVCRMLREFTCQTTIAEGITRTTCRLSRFLPAFETHFQHQSRSDIGHFRSVL